MTTANQHPLEKILESRIAIIDGAMGTTIRTYGMKEADIRGERFKDSKKDLLNNGDLFSLTQPKMICDIHRRFLEAGADIIETNTFGATSITQSEFFVDDPREHGGRKDPEFYQKDHRGPVPQRPRLGDQRAVGAAVPRVGRPRRQRRRDASASSPAPSGRSPSRSRTRPTPTIAGFRVVTFDQVKTAYAEQVRALIAGGSDLLLVETIFDSLNAKAALVAIREVFDEDGKQAAGHDLGGGRPRRRDDDLRADHRGVLERGEAREAALRRPQLLARPRPDVSVPRGAVGEGERGDLLLPERRPAESALADRLRSRAGRHGPLPRRVRAGRPDQHRRRLLRQHAGAHRGHRQGARRQSLRASSASSRSQRERAPKRSRRSETKPLRLSGSQPFTQQPGVYIMIGERTNVAGSPKFAKLIKEGKYEEAVSVARQQVENGANVIDICMDEGMIDGVAAMTRFLQLLGERARGRQGAVHGRLLEVGGHRGGPEVPAGQGHRQLDLAEGRRREVPPERRARC